LRDVACNNVEGWWGWQRGGRVNITRQVWWGRWQVGGWGVERAGRRRPPLPMAAGSAVSRSPRRGASRARLSATSCRPQRQRRQRVRARECACAPVVRRARPRASHANRCAQVEGSREEGYVGKMPLPVQSVCAPQAGSSERQHRNGVVGVKRQPTARKLNNVHEEYPELRPDPGGEAG